MWLSAQPCISATLYIHHFIANLSLYIGTQSMVFSFPGVTMTVGLPTCENLTFVFYQSFDLFVIFIEPVLVTFDFEPDCFFAGIRQISFDMGPLFFNCKITVRLSSGFESSLSFKPPLNWLLVSKSLSLPTSSFLLEVCCFRCFGAMRIVTLTRISLWSVGQAVEPAIALIEMTSAWFRCRMMT